MILVSSCLLGIHSKYDGSLNNQHDLLMKYSHLGQYLPVCPEQLGGLQTPRKPVEIIGGTGSDVLAGTARTENTESVNLTSEFIKGAQETYRLTKIFPIKAAILKERSPSCGVHQIYDGGFRHVIREGSGVTAELLRQNGIEVFSEEDLTEELLVRLLEI